MPGFLLEKPYPGATSCVVIGGLGSDAGADLHRYRSVLWCVDSGSRDHPAAGFRGESLQTVSIDTAAPAAFTPVLEKFVRRDPRRLPSIFVSADVLSRHVDRYKNVIAETHALLESHHRARVTRQKDGFVWQKHVLQNLPAYAQRRVPSSWAGALRGLPAFVCGAGPSLDVSAAKLAAVAGHGVIFSADSALRALARHGVTADFAVSIDAAKVPDKCLPSGPETMPHRVVLSPLSPSSWGRAVPAERQFFLSGTQVTVDWLAASGVARTAIAATENCGSTALELARYLGCAPIYLFGLDLALDAANPAHRHHAGADAALYTDSGYNPSQQHPFVPGNYATEVPTFAYGDWVALDARLATWPDGLVFNVNDRGARFRNTTLVHPDQFSLVDARAQKGPALAALAQPGELGPPAAQPAFDLLRAAGARSHAAVPGLRSTLAERGPAAVADALRELFIDPTLSRAMGAFSLKLMPHLVPPIEGDAAFWSTLLDEFEQLTSLARAVYRRPEEA